MKYKEIIKYLVSYGADLDIQNDHGDTPLIISCYKKNITLIQYLYKNGANISIKNENNESFLTIVSKSNFNDKLDDIKEILNQKRNDGDTALTFACKIGNEEEIKMLIDFGVDVNIHNKHDDSAIMILCKNNSITNDKKIKLIEDIITKNGKVNKKNKYGFSPLIIACYFNNVELIEFLLSKNANLDTKNSDNDTPLSIACYFNNEKIIKLLVNKGITINEKNKDNETPLMISKTFENNDDIIEFLEKNININGNESILFKNIFIN